MTPKFPLLRLPHAQIHLPPLGPQEALLLSNLLDKTITAIWRAHGDQIDAFLAFSHQQPSLNRQPEPSTPPTQPTDDDLF